MNAPLSRRSLFGAAALAAVPPTALTALPVTASAAPPVSAEAGDLQAELARLSSAYRQACRESDDLLSAVPEIEPPEAIFSRAGDAQLLWGRVPVKSWTTGRSWFGDDDLIDRLRADPFRYIDGSPTPGAARRDEIVGAWDRWRGACKAAEDANGYTAAEERFQAAHDAYAAFRSRLVEMRTEDPEVLTVKALAIADLLRGTPRGLGHAIERAMRREGGACEDALALSLARDFVEMLRVDRQVAA